MKRLIPLLLLLASSAFASTASYNIPNETGAAFRADVNANLAAIVSQNSSATAPVYTFPYMMWADTSSDTMKQRNAADSGWVSLYTLSTGTWITGGGGGGSGSVATDTIWDEAGDLAVGSGANTATKLSKGSALQVLRVNSGATGLEYATLPGGGNALTTDPLSQFAATTSAQLAGVISNETGSGALVFATSPALVTPALGTPSSGTLTNTTGLPIVGGTTGTLSVARGGTGVTAAQGTGTKVQMSTGTTTTGHCVSYDATGNTQDSGAACGAGGGGGAFGTPVSETPSGTINGSNVTFTLSHTPNSGTLILVKNGLALTPTTDYTVSTATITMGSAPSGSDALYAFYLYGSGGSGAMTASGYTMNTNKLLGRGTAAAGAIEEITLGTNLSLSGTTLNAAGGSGSMATDAIWDAVGDIVYGTGADTASRLAPNTTTTKKFLTETGTGSAGQAPAWGTLASGDIPNNAANTTGTAAALAANGSNCSAGNYPLGVDASGAAESCTALPTFPSGTVVGTTDTQTLSSKTLTQPTINDGYIEETFTNTPSGTLQLAMTDGSMQVFTLTANRTFKLPAVGTKGLTLTLAFLASGGAYSPTIQDSAAGTSAIKWSGGSAPTWTATSGKTDAVVCTTFDTSYWYCSSGGLNY